MTNMERLKALPPEELAWFLMAYSDNCRCCIYKRVGENGHFDSFSWEKCDRNDVDDTCIGGYRKWLEAESSDDDDYMFRLCHNNEIVGRWNAMTPSLRDGFKLRFENGLAVEIVDDVDDDIEWTPKPLPF